MLLQQTLAKTFSYMLLGRDEQLYFTKSPPKTFTSETVDVPIYTNAILILCSRVGAGISVTTSPKYNALGKVIIMTQIK